MIGCNTVLSDPSSKLGGLIPISAFGLLFYVLILTLSLRWSKNGEYFGRLIAISGVIISLFLLAYLKIVLRGSCVYCFASSILAAAILLTFGYPATNRLSAKSISTTVVPCWIALSLCGLAYYKIYPLEKVFNTHNAAALNDIPYARLIVPDRVDFGKGSSTIVLFTDAECPFCNKLFPKVVEACNQSLGISLRVVHYPLASHPNSMRSAVFAECMASKGMRVAYLTEVARLKPQTLNDFVKIEDAFLERFGTVSGEVYKEARARVEADKSLCAEIAVQGTPFMVLVGNHQRKVIWQDELARLDFHGSMSFTR